MGKTHLINSIGSYILETRPSFKILYESAEKFFNECISSLRKNDMERFRNKYRKSADVLLMDDVQIFNRGEAIQEEFFHTIQYFLEVKKQAQIVVASDRMPQDIKGLESRIRTRLQWGIVADIGMPDLETRINILLCKIEKKNIHVHPQVINFIAKISKLSIRELEGNFNKVKMFSELQGVSISLELAKKVLHYHNKSSELSVDDIISHTAKFFSIRDNVIRSKSRKKEIVEARQVAMYLIRKIIGKTLSEIGNHFGGKDHTTVINSIKKVEAKIDTNKEFEKNINHLTNKIHTVCGI